MKTPRRVINAMAPISICDLGGWTDTWFAETGAVFNIGVYPYAEVQIYVREMPSDAPRIKLQNTRDMGAEIVEYDRRRESR